LLFVEFPLKLQDHILGMPAQHSNHQVGDIDWTFTCSHVEPNSQKKKAMRQVLHASTVFLNPDTSMNVKTRSAIVQIVNAASVSAKVAVINGRWEV
jgi:hypothetical protein